jgi:hypothetical protein
MGYGDVEMIDANGIRNDGRKAGDVRPISIELGVVPVADGSCRMKWAIMMLLLLYTVLWKHIQGKSKDKIEQFLMSGITWHHSPHLIESGLVSIEEVEKSVKLQQKH